VGRISVGGIVGFFLFIGVPFGVAAAAAYLLLRRWLPSGRAGGLALGTLLLLVVGNRIDPLRANNPDFSLVGPAWVAVVALWHDRRVVTVGRVALAAVGLAALPGFVSALVDILGPA
jgi:hypothetical protein